MKLLRLLLPCLLLAGALAACKKSDSTASAAKVEVFFSNEANGRPVILDSTYVNAAGNPYTISLLKYYITNFTLLRTDSVERNFRNYDLIDQGDSSSRSFSADSVMNGDYYAVRFLLGVDYDHNHTGAQEGDLDPSKGMIWSWNTGYIFYKHEGTFKDNTGASHPFAYHYGNDRSLVSVTLPISKLSIRGVNKKLYLRLNLDSLYGAPTKLDFNADNNRMSGRDDDFWLTIMSNNFTHAFQYVKTE